jgi:hypothetical protein
MFSTTTVGKCYLFKNTKSCRHSDILMRGLSQSWLSPNSIFVPKPTYTKAKATHLFSRVSKNSTEFNRKIHIQCKTTGPTPHKRVWTLDWLKCNKISVGLFKYFIDMKILKNKNHIHYKSTH